MSCGMARNSRSLNLAPIFLCWRRLMISRVPRKLFCPWTGRRIAVMSNCSVDQPATKRQSCSSEGLAPRTSLLAPSSQLFLLVSSQQSVVLCRPRHFPPCALLPAPSLVLLPLTAYRLPLRFFRPRSSPLPLPAPRSKLPASFARIAPLCS